VGAAGGRRELPRHRNTRGAITVAFREPECGHSHSVVALGVLFVTGQGCNTKTDASTGPTDPSGTTSSNGGVPGTYTLSGVVRRADFARTPLENASVQILDGPRAGAVATTDATGAYTISDVPAGKLQIIASRMSSFRTGL
jgi:hypothetical protein